MPPQGGIPRFPIQFVEKRGPRAYSRFRDRAGLSHGSFTAFVSLRLISNIGVVWIGLPIFILSESAGDRRLVLPGMRIGSRIGWFSRRRCQPGLVGCLRRSAVCQRRVVIEDEVVSILTHTSGTTGRLFTFEDNGYPRSSRQNRRLRRVYISEAMFKQPAENSNATPTEEKRSADV